MAGGRLHNVDLHVHTRISKGFDFDEQVIPRLRSLGERRGLTAFALTEHIHAKEFWAMHELLQSRYPYDGTRYDLGGGFRMFSGCEVTVAERVDFIVVGGLEEIRVLDGVFRAPLSESYFPPGIDFLTEARRRELLVISAHPYREGKQTAKLPLAEVFSRVHAVEVNGRDHGNEKKVAQLAHEAGLPVSGGSDAHFYLQVGIRNTVVPCPSELTFPALLNAFESHSTSAHCKPYAPAVVQLCQEIKRVMKMRNPAAATAAA
jgi:predicted metal-dependent phosphoesterase TrpH